MKLGVTGTRKGISMQQKQRLEFIIATHDVKEFHHGDCVGADAQAHAIVSTFKNIKRICHPPSSDAYRAHTTNEDTWDALYYIYRNKDIVDCSDILVAMPRSTREELRSGTWQTIRYARKMKKRIIIIYPMGNVFYENFK